MRIIQDSTITLQLGGDLHGDRKLRIGELADKSGVTKRTIDYYTNFGLLKAERSPSNYRYYDETAIERIAYIEQAKKDGLSLEEIKREATNRFNENMDVVKLQHSMLGLEKEVTDVLTHFDQATPEKLNELKRSLSPQGLSLIQALALLLN